MPKFSFDEQCLELARYFYPDDSDEMLNPLAQLLQETVEGFTPSGIIRADGTTLHASHCTLFDIEKTCTCDPQSTTESATGTLGTRACAVPPKGWRCTREAGHEGPCAAVPS